MNNKLFYSWAFIFVSFLVVGLLGCGSSGGGGSEDDSSGIINGRVESVAEARLDNNSDSSKKSSFYSSIKEFLVFFPYAIAQEGGITVNVIQDSIIIDTTTTDDDGNFTVTGAGDVILQFITPGGTNVEVGINIPVGTVTTLSISIDENTQDAVIEEEQNGISCEGGEVNISDIEVVIDGNGVDDCIDAEGDCQVNIDADTVIFQNCDRCIDAENDSNVTINADSIICEGADDGIRGEDNAVVTLIGADCTIIGSIDQEDSSVIDIGSCENIPGVDDDGDTEEDETDTEDTDEDTEEDDTDTEDTDEDTEEDDADTEDTDEDTEEDDADTEDTDEDTEELII